MSYVVRAKFKCTSKTIYAPAQGDAVQHNIVLEPYYGNGDDNRSWSKWTPTGKIEMTVTNPDAANAFIPGEEYYIDFEKVPPKSEVTSSQPRS